MGCHEGGTGFLRWPGPSTTVLGVGFAALGGWLLATAAPLPQRLTVDQGEAVGRPCRLGLEVTSGGEIRVSGRVIEIGRGTIEL